MEQWEDLSWIARRGPDVGLDDLHDELVKGVEVLGTGVGPGAVDQTEDLGNGQLLGQQREHHDAPFGLLRQQVRVGLLTRSSLDALHDRLGLGADVLREVKEETGLDARDAEGGYLFTYKRENPGEGDNYFVDVYRFVMDVDEKDLSLQTEETDGHMFATLEQIQAFAAEGKFLHYDSIRKAFERQE